MPPSESQRLLQDLIAQGEHQQQDFKFKVQDAPKLARSVSAFANTDGGRLLIGVRDDGFVHGVRSDEEIYMMHAAADDFCTPKPDIRFRTLHVPTQPHGGRQRTVVLCTVMPAPDRPVFALEPEDGTPQAGRRKLTAYVRVADQNIAASPVHLAVWRQDAHLRGEAFGDTQQERSILAALSLHTEGLPLNRLLRHARPIPRRQGIELVARFVRFGLARMEHQGRQWLFFPAG